MIALLIIAAVLILLMLTKVGFDAAYSSVGAALTVKLGPARIQLLPQPKKTEKAKKPRKKKKGKKEKTGKKEKNDNSEKPKRKLSFSSLFELVKIALRALNRFRISIRVDLFRLRFIMGSADPYTTAITYGYVQTAVGMLTPKLRRAFTVRESHVEMGTDFLAEKPEIDARLVLTIRIGRIFVVLFAAGWEFLRFYFRQKRKKKSKSADRGRVAAAEDADPARKSA